MKTKMNPAMGGGASASKKLLAAIAVLAVAFVVFAAIPAVDADSEGPVASADPLNGMISPTVIPANGVYTLTDDTTVTLTGNVTLNDFKFSGASTLTITSGNSGHYKLNVNYDFKDNPFNSTTGSIFQVSGVVINNADLTIVQEDTGKTVGPGSNEAGCSVFGAGSVEVKGDSTLTITTDKFANRVFYNNGSSLTIDGSSAKVVLDKATSSTVSLSMSNGAALEIKNPLFSAGNFYPNVDNTSNNATPCSITVSGARDGNHGLFFFGSTDNGGSTDGSLRNVNVKSDGIVGFYSHKSVDATGSTIEADKLVVAKSGAAAMADVTGAIFKVSSVQAINPNDGYKAVDDKTLDLGHVIFTGNTTIGSGVTVNVKSGATLTVAKKATLSVAGNLTGQGTVDNKGVVESLNGGNITTKVTGNETTSRTDDSQMENVSIEGTVKGTDNVFDKDQLATVKGNSVMAEGSKLVINGKLYIPEGATLTLMPGAQLVLQNNAVLEVEGKLIIEEKYDGEPAKIDVVSGKIIVSGSIEDGGEINVTSGSVEIKADGAVIVGEAGKLVSSKVSVEESATLQVNGTLGGKTNDQTVKTVVDNAGTVIFDSMVASENVTINMKNGGAVDVKNLTLKNNGFVTIQDKENKIELKATTSATRYFDNADSNGAYVAAVISGVSVTEQITQNKDNSYTYVMDISGNAIVDYVYVAAGEENEAEGMNASALITLAGSTDAEKKDGISIAGALTVGEKVTVANAGKLTVSATVDASKGTFTNKGTVTIGETSSERMGTLTVTGEGKVVVNASITGGTVNATMYETGTTTKLYNYVTLDAALAAANAGTTKSIAVLGEQALTASATLPKDVKLDLSGAKTLDIGKDAEATGVTLTVASGASVKNKPTADDASITVNGTVYAEKKTDIDSAVREMLTAGADVYSEELDEKGQAIRDGWAKWTNISTALIEAPEGSVVKITKDLTIKTDLTIPEKVTLDTNGNNVAVFPGVTITDNGILSITNNGNTFVLSNKTDDKDAAKIVLNGEIVSNDEIEFLKGTYVKNDDGTESVTATDNEYIVGAAYYSITTKNVTKYYATTVEKAAPLISTVDEQKITLKGAELTVGDVSFEGMSAEEPLATVIVEAGKLKASSITLANAKIGFTGGQTFQGTIKDAAGSIVLKGTAGIAAVTNDDGVVTTPAVSFSVESGKALAVTGDFKVEKDPVVFSGAVSVKAGTIDNAKVEGTLTVAGDAKITTITVNGAVSIDAGKTLTTETATVFGTIAGAAKDASGNEGKLNVKVMYIGIAAKDILVSTGATASVTGNVTLSNYALVAPGTTVPEAFTKEGVKTTAFYIGDNLYLTAYAGTAVTGEIATVDAHIENARFDGWYNDKNEKAIVSSETDTPAVVGQKFGATGFEKVTAKVVYDIYKVVLKADEGIADVYLNGQAMFYGLVEGGNGYYYAYTATVSAGDYKVTYTLKNGWSGEAKLTGENVTGTSFKATGTPANGQQSISLVYQLSGVEKSGYVEPVTPSEDNGDDGLTVTDYLLIVLVVLIVIMAVIVAMRLMRS